MVQYDISVYNANQKKLCTQLDTTYPTEGEQSDVSISQEMNGWKELTFAIPWVVGKEKNFRMDFLKNENTIRVIRNSDVTGVYEDWFLIREPEDAHSGKTKELTVSCEHISSELKTKNLYVYFDDTNGIDTIGNLISKALHGSGWTQGFCDTLYEADGTTEKVRSYSCDEKTGAYNMVAGICDLFMAYPTFNGADKTVDIHAISNKTGNMELNYGKNMDSLHRSPNSTDIVTRLYVEGDYSDLGYVGIEDVNPTGLGYIMNFDYYKEIGAFTDEHQAALDTYIETAKQQKTQIETTSASMLDKETRLSELWGTGKYVLYSVSNGQATAQYLGNGAEQEDAAFKEDDLVVAVKNGGEYSYVTASAGMTFGADIVYAVKFLTPSAGQIGGKEVAIEAKEKTIETLTEAKEEADSEKEKAELQNQINTTQQEINNLKNGTAESEGSYALMWEAVTTVLEIKTLEATVKSAQEDMAEAEQTFVDAMGNMLHDGYWNNSNYTVGQEESLYADAVEILKIMSRPTVTYSMSFLNLAALSDYKMEEIKLNMRVRIYDFELGVNDWGFIEKIVEYPLAERENTVTISTDELNISANTFESVLNRMMEAANIIDQRNAIYERAAAISEGGTISADQLNGEIDLLKNHLASTKSGWYTDANGNIMFEAQDGQSAMMLSGSGFMVANGKDASGNWNWRTFGTGEGFTADLITAGILRAGTITILGTDQFYWDADNIYIFDPGDPDRQIRIGKYDGTNYGIGYTKDNGDTWQNAIGFDGVTQSTTTTATIESAQATADSALAAANAAQTAAGNAQTTADSAQSAANANASDLANYITSNNAEIENLQGQIDGAITTWFYEVPPTNDNPPANQWTTTDMKNIHLGDLYYDTITGYCYRWQVQNNQYSWQRITDTDVTKALEDAAEAQDTADAKRRVFVTQPTPPYDVGDLWVQGATGDILRCNTAKTAQQSFSSSDWVLASKYTDNTVANAAQEAAENAQNTANNAQAAADENAEAIAGLGTRVTTVEQKVTPDAIVQTVTQSETYQNEIGGLDERISTAESKLTPEAMETTIENSEALSEVRQTADKINWIVESGTSSSNMTLTDDALNVISEGITLTADKINLVANDINLSGNSSVNTIVSNAVDPLETDIDSLTTRMTQAETSITQNTEAIELRATKEEVQTAQDTADFATPLTGAEPPDEAPAVGKLWIDEGQVPSVWRRWRGADVSTDREYEETISGDADSPAFVAIDNAQGQLQEAELEVGCVTQQAGAGDPSPTNIRAISGRESVEVQACGKNMATTQPVIVSTQEQIVIDFGRDVHFDAITVSFVAKNLTMRGPQAASIDLRLADGTHQYRTWWDFLINGQAIQASGNPDGLAICTLNNVTFRQLVVYWMTDVYARIGEGSELSDFQLELGSSSLAYEPYTPMGGGVVTPSEPLYGLPDAMDTVEVDASGDVTVTRRTAVVELDGTESITYGNAGASTEVQQFNASQLAVGGVGDINSPVICSHLPYSPNVSGGAALGIGLFPSSPHALIVFGMPIAALTQYGYIIGEQDTWVPAFKAYLAAQNAAGTPVTIVYELAVPETEALTAISPITPEAGPVNIWTDADALTATVRGSGWEIINDTDDLSADIQEAQDDISGMVGSINTIENNISAMASQILTPDQIISTVVESTDFQTVSTQVIQTGEGLAIVQTTVDDLGDRVDVIEGAVVIEGANIDIGRSDSNTRLHLDNEGQDILEDGQATISVRDNKVVSPRYHVTDALIIGNLALRPSGGHLRLLKYGG